MTLPSHTAKTSKGIMGYKQHERANIPNEVAL